MILDIIYGILGLIIYALIMFAPILLPVLAYHFFWHKVKSPIIRILLLISAVMIGLAPALSFTMYLRSQICC